MTPLIKHGVVAMELKGDSYKNTRTMSATAEQFQNNLKQIKKYLKKNIIYKQTSK